MSDESLDLLKMAERLVKDAVKYVERCKGTLTASDEVRESVLKQIGTLKVAMSTLTHHLAELAAEVNRRKVRKHT